MQEKWNFSCKMVRAGDSLCPAQGSVPRLADAPKWTGETMKIRFFPAYALALAACWLAWPAARADDAAAQRDAVVRASASTAVAASSEIGGAALIPVADGHGEPRIVAATGLGGLELYALDGTRLGATPAGEVVAIDVGRVPLGGGKATVVAALDASSHSLRLFRFAGDRLEEVGARQIALGFAAEGLC